MSYWPFGTEADIGLRVFGSSIDSIFRDNHAGMMNIIASDNLLTTEIQQTYSNEFSLSLPIDESGENFDMLLVAFLEEILYRLEVNDQWVYDSRIKVTKNLTDAVCQGILYFIPKEFVNTELEIKAITTHLLHITRVETDQVVSSDNTDVPEFRGPGYYSDLVFDI